jgi:hypothetical protein
LLLQFCLSLMAVANSSGENVPAVPTPQGKACAPGAADVPIAKEPASAGIMYNLAEHPKSIRAVAGRLLIEALEKQQSPAAGLTCADCKNPARPRVVYTVAPVHFLQEREQKAVCLRLDAQTRKRPFEFAPRRFATVTELNDWVMEFSQGRGTEGQELYRLCAANCSPRYQFEIAQDADGLSVTTQVQCGLARDRASDEYAVSTALRVGCAVEKRAVAEVRP